jgi:hypothetical protein
MMNTKIKHYVAALVMALLPMLAAATPATLSIEDFTISAGETKTMLVDLNNPDTEVTLVQFDLRLPTGLSIAVEDEDLAVDIAGRTTWKKHSLSTSDVNGATRFLLASQSNTVLTGTSGAIISITLTAASTFNGGDIKLEGQLIVPPTEEATKPADYTYNIAGSTSETTAATLSIEDFTISAGETKTMLVDLNNPDTQVTLVQFDLRLPTGLSIAVANEELAVDIAGRTTWKKHSLSTSSVNGATRFLLASQSNALITGTSGAIISITLTASNTFNGGDIKLEGQLIVTPTEEATTPDDYTYHIAGASGEKCATPTITVKNGKLTFACGTAGAVCHYEITRAGEGNTVTLASTADYVVSVWATKAGYSDSDVATTTITLKQGDVNADGNVSITDAVSVVNIILNNGEATAPAMESPAVEAPEAGEPE